MDISKILGAGGGGGGQAMNFARNAMGGLGGLGGTQMMGPGAGPKPGPAPNPMGGQGGPGWQGMTPEDMWGGGTNPAIAYRMGGMSALNPFNQQMLQQRLDQANPPPASPLAGMNPNALAPYYTANRGGPQVGGLFGKMR